jgi:SOS response regulatory protein OraA/RecX
VARDPNLVRLRVGRKNIGELPRRELETLSLRNDQPWTAKIEAAVNSTFQKLKCNTSAMRLLAVRPYFACELRDRLVSKGFDLPLSERTVQQLVADGWIDEARQAAQLADELRRRGLSDTMIRRRMASKGLQPSLINSTVEGATGERRVELLALARQRLNAMKGIPRLAAARRLFAYLSRRGHEGANIRAALKQLDLPVSEE